MDAIDKIIAEIDNKAQSERASRKAQEEAQIATWYEQEVAKAKSVHEAQLAKQTKALKQKYKQLASRQQMEVRQETLIQKQDYLDQLFEEAHEIMSKWDTSKIQRFAKDNLTALALDQKAVLLPSGASVIAALTPDYLASLNLPYPLELGTGKEAGTPGFVVDVSGVQYNFLYRDLLQEVRNQDGNELTKKLFS
ncbi:V-type ATP synthase subunit E [Enterococcus asini]|uniref:V-type ATP synthase subunit E n=1 Tax=Enterococcus asini TaxID=57732 RepID=UPI001E5EB79B|nr:V-type ATP synthase subunit E [Enterococcus asini]MCD5028504.1 V-type ATP synthase subunit E [Enterococcus asini]MDT2783293.1 V-type ATP synthase subunit E [Enterococcus asini]